MIIENKEEYGHISNLLVFIHKTELEKVKGLTGGEMMNIVSSANVILKILKEHKKHLGISDVAIDKKKKKLFGVI